MGAVGYKECVHIVVIAVERTVGRSKFNANGVVSRCKELGGNDDVTALPYRFCHVATIYRQPADLFSGKIELQGLIVRLIVKGDFYRSVRIDIRKRIDIERQVVGNIRHARFALACQLAAHTRFNIAAEVFETNENMTTQRNSGLILHIILTIRSHLKTEVSHKVSIFFDTSGFSVLESAPNRIRNNCMIAMWQNILIFV